MATQTNNMIVRCFGLGSLLAYVFLSVWSRAFYVDFELASSSQLMLTASADAGCLALVVIALCLGGAGRRAPLLKVRRNGKYYMALGSAGIAVSTLLKMGSIVSLGPVSLVAGDVLCGFFTMACVCLWWASCSRMDERSALTCLSGGLVVGSVLFVAVCLALPASVQGFSGGLVLPLASCLSFRWPYEEQGSDGSPRESGIVAGAAGAAASKAQGQQCGVDDGAGAPSGLTRPTEPTEQTKPTKPTRHMEPEVPTRPSGPTKESLGIPALFLVTVALAFFTVSLLPGLFPVSLYFEGTVGPSLPDPGLWCAVLTVAFALALAVLNRRGSVALPFVYTTGFILVALGYLVTPYRPVGGFPLAAGEAGRLITCVYALMLVRRLSLGKGWNNRTEKRSVAFLLFAAVALFAMMAADAVVMVMQVQPGFDYSDFTFRTVFSGVAIGVLVVLLVRPLPLTDAALGPHSVAAPNDVEEEPSAPAPTSAPALASASVAGFSGDAQSRVTAFAREHALSARETEVFALIAAGRDVPYIERELVLSKSTVKTHVKHIYEKCGVSSRQSLLDLYESFPQ